MENSREIIISGIKKPKINMRKNGRITVERKINDRFHIIYSPTKKMIVFSQKQNLVIFIKNCFII